MKGDDIMILATILAIVAVILIVFAVLVITIGGSAFIIVFADVLVCAAIIVWIIKAILKRKR